MLQPKREVLNIWFHFCTSRQEICLGLKSLQVFVSLLSWWGAELQLDSTGLYSHREARASIRIQVLSRGRTAARKKVGILYLRYTRLPE